MHKLEIHVSVYDYVGALKIFHNLQYKTSSFITQN
jgi:hypothetical protein